MAELVQLTKNETSHGVAELASYANMFQNEVFSWSSIVLAVVFSLGFSYILGQRTIKKNVIIDNTLKENLENVEQTKKKLIKKMAYWTDTVDGLKWFGFFIAFVLSIYGILYFLSPEYVELVQPYVKNVYFVQGLALIIICLFVLIKFALYKKKSIKSEYSDIDQEAQSLFEEILNKMGSKLTKSMSDALLKKRETKQTKGYCKKEICRRQKVILDKKSKNSQNLLAEIGKFDWCPICSSELDFSPTAGVYPQENLKEKKVEEGKETETETDEYKCRSTIDREIQTEEFVCKKNCGKRFFRYCKSKGGAYKEQIDEVTVLENQLRQMEAEYNRENNIFTGK